MTIRVLLVEDDARLADSVMQFFELFDIAVDPCNNGRQAVSLMQANDYDVVVSDVNMPKMNGLQFCKYLRDEGINIPFIFVSANDDIEDKLAGFDTGADDYLTKPFELRELMARVNVLSKRRSGQSNKLSIDEFPLHINFNQRVATRDDQQLKLTPSGWKMLEKLARNYPEPVSKADLEFAIWGDELPDSNALKVHIHNLRKSIDKPFTFPILQAVNGFGFRLARC
ncbi:two-component system response regulator [Saccharobesus litoralis]|uniref:Two-component system response regulator n=1 Tax=Saccharobesus litoralis TaxID=2172099 RepID=A0A2S0VRU7_9ALTE|nr:response regulator transcription factor [Saccharobesus litoralis]AWB66929.1 two-component system response regulator [Saccharobesus litoralis]